MSKNMLEVINCKEIKINETIRLGKKADGRVSPLLLKLHKEQSRQKILRNAKNLKNTRKLWAKRVILQKT